MRYTSNTAEDTFLLGKQMGEQARPGQVYALEGDLAAGKTVFAKGFAAGLGVAEDVSSPTFTILQVYEGGRLPLYHFDVYRIGDPEEMEEIGFEEYVNGDGVCLIEWASLVEELLPETTIWVKLAREPKEGLNVRLITIDDPPSHHC